jgi:pyruvate dehydrogenase E1 component alpha subunit
MDTTATVAEASVATLERGHALHLLKEMVRIRRFEEKCAELYQAMKIRGFLHLYIGEEAVAVGVSQALVKEDAIVATYREHGQAMAKGLSMGSMMAEMYGKQEGCSRGRGGSMHFFDAETRVCGGNGIVAGGIPMAIGLALADKMLGRKNVTVCYFGDGAMAEGAFHESMNLAALWTLPVLFLCENNYYAMGTALRYSHSETDLVKKAGGYNMPVSWVDGMDVLAVEAAAREAIDSIRAGEGPQFIEARTFRFRPHSMFDAELYREKKEVEEWKKRDPITTFLARLKEAEMVTDQDVADIERDVAAEVGEAVAFAEAGTWEPVEDLTRFVHSERVTS